MELVVKDLGLGQVLLGVRRQVLSFVSANALYSFSLSLSDAV